MHRLTVLVSAAMGAASLSITRSLPGPGGACAARPRPRAALRMEMQELEFIIHADGRVEERVRGVKGANCQEITAKIESALGEVYHTEATEEMFEVEVQNTNENTNSAEWGSGGGGEGDSGGGGGGWSGGGGW